MSFSSLFTSLSPARYFSRMNVIAVLRDSSLGVGMEAMNRCLFYGVRFIGSCSGSSNQGLIRMPNLVSLGITYVSFLIITSNLSERELKHCFLRILLPTLCPVIAFEILL